MSRIYISPSTQERNLYAGGGNEEQWMREVCYHTVPALQAAGHDVRLGGTISARTNALDGNAWGAKWYVAVHSNAGGTGVGTEVWHYPRSEKGKLLANAVYKHVAPVSFSKDRGVKTSKEYIELNTPNCPSIIVEVDFHDKLANANEIKAKHAEYGIAIAKGVLEVAGSSSIPIPDNGLAPVYRLLKDGHHMWTASDSEKNTLISKGWTYEGVAWYVPKA